MAIDTAAATGSPPTALSGSATTASPRGRTWPHPWAPPIDRSSPVAPASRRPVRRHLVVAAWIGAAVVALLVARTALPELRQAWQAIAGAHRGWLAAAAVVEIVALVVLPLPLHGALETIGGRARYGALLDATVGAFALSRVVPAGGLAGAAYAARRITRAGNAATVAVAAVTVVSVTTMVTLGAVVVGALIAEAVAGRGSTGVAWAVFAGLAAAAGAGIAMARLLRHPQRLEQASAGLARFVRRPALTATIRCQLAVLGPLLGRPAPLGRVAGWTALNWLLQLAALWTVFLAFGVSLPIGVLIVGFGAANLATALPHTPGGLGVVEAGMAATYIALGVPAGTALVGVLCYRLIGHWLPVLAALPLIVPRLHAARRPAGQLAGGSGVAP